MLCERLRAAGDPAGLAAEIRALVPAAESVRDAVAEVIAEVRSRGDKALDDYTRRFDTGAAAPRPLRVSEDDLEAGASDLHPDVLAGLELAIHNVGRVAEAGLCSEASVRFDRHEVALRSSPVASAGVYVPGGRAPYPSTVVMGVVTARVAGVKRVSVCSPPGRDGDLHPVVLGACWLTGVDAVYRVGGAQAVAALAYGTESVASVDVIVGPGNLYVQEAKRQVFGDVGIDGFAGPSDLVVIADGDADPGPLALDLLAQAEHGPGTLVIAISDSDAVLRALGERVVDTGQPGGLIASGSTGGFTANPNNYAQNLNTDNAASEAYYNQGQNFNENTPSAFNPDQAGSQGQMANTFAGQGALESQLQGVIANPSTSQASQQFSSGVKQAAAGTTALGNSSGSGPAAAGARRNAQQTNAVAGAASVAGQAQVDAAAQAQARADLSGVLGQQGGLANQQYGMENQNAQTYAQIQANQGKLNDSAATGFSGLSANAQGMAVNDLTGYSNDLLAQAGASSAEQTTSNQFGNQIFGAGLGAATGLAGGIASAYGGGGDSGAPPENAIAPDGIATPTGDISGNTSDYV